MYEEAEAAENICIRKTSSSCPQIPSEGESLTSERMENRFILSAEIYISAPYNSYNVTWKFLPVIALTFLSFFLSFQPNAFPVVTTNTENANVPESASKFFYITFGDVY